VAIYRGALIFGDGVRKLGSPLSFADAVDRRKKGEDIIVCGDNGRENYAEAMKIEQAACGTRPNFDPPHLPTGLSHFQPPVRPPLGHCFFEEPGLGRRASR
jgi:hypothetical protein